MRASAIRHDATAALAAAVLFLGCSDKSKCVLTAPLCDIKTVVVEPNDVLLTAPGQTVQLAVVARDENGIVLDIGSPALNWVSSATGVVTVSPTGLVTAVGGGTAKITVTADVVPDSARSADVGVDFSAVPTLLAMSTQPGGAPAASLLSPQPVVQFQNAGGQVVAYAGNVAASVNSGGGSLAGTTTVAAVAGTATFSDLVITGATGQHTLRFTASGVADAVSAPFDVTPQVAAGGIVFQSNWLTALGTSDAAVGDAGAWQQIQWGREWMQVVADPDFPTGRALYIGYHGGLTSTGAVGSSGDVIIKNVWPVPAVGQTIFFRVYYKNAIRNSVGDLGIGGDHPFQGFDNNEGAVSGNCSRDWNFKFGPKGNGTHSWLFFTNGNSWGKTGLLKFQAHRLEAAFTRAGTDSYTVRMRLNGADISSEIGLPTTPMPIGDACLRTLFIGNNDPGYGSNESDTDPTRWRNFNGTPKTGGPYNDLDSYRWGAIAVAIRSDANAWIGPYVP